MASTNHPPHPRPGASPAASALGWTSGACITAEEIRAADVWTDDILLIGDVLADVYLIEFKGKRVVIDWRERGDGNKSGVLIRGRDDTLHRVREAV